MTSLMMRFAVASLSDALEAVADLDAQRAVILGDHENGAVVDLLAADLPLLGHAQRELLDRLRCGGRHHQHGELAAFPRLEFLQRALEPGVLLAGQRAGLVDHAPGERRHGDLRPGEPERKQEQLHRDLIYFLPKSTFGALRDFALVLDREVGLGLEAEHHRGQVRREGAHGDVVVLHRLDVAVAGHRDAVLGALELRLQIAEVGVRLELRIVLGHHQQARKRAGELALRSLELARTLPGCRPAPAWPGCCRRAPALRSRA